MRFFSQKVRFSHPQAPFFSEWVWSHVFFNELDENHEKLMRLNPDDLYHALETLTVDELLFPEKLKYWCIFMTQHPAPDRLWIETLARKLNLSFKEKLVSLIMMGDSESLNLFFQANALTDVDLTPEAFELDLFNTAALHGELWILNSLLNLFKTNSVQFIQYQDYQPIRQAMLGNRLAIVHYFLTLANENRIEMVTAQEFSLYKMSAQMGYLSLFEALVLICPLPLFIAQNCLAEACQNGHAPLVDFIFRFFSYDPKLLGAMIEINDYETFRQACASGHESVLSTLILHYGLFYPERINAMLTIRNFEGPRLCFENGHEEAYYRLLTLFMHLNPLTHRSDNPTKTNVWESKVFPFLEESPQPLTPYETFSSRFFPALFEIEPEMPYPPELVQSIENLLA